MIAFRLVAYSTVPLTCIAVPFLLATSGGRIRRPLAWCGGGLGAMVLLGLWSGAPLSVLAGLTAYCACLGLFFGALFMFLQSARVSAGGAQAVCGLLVAVLVGLVFMSRGLWVGARTAEENQRVVSAISDLSPILVTGSILGESPAHSWGRLYEISHLADYGQVGADWPRVCLLWAVTGTALSLASYALTKLLGAAGGPSTVQPASTVSANR